MRGTAKQLKHNFNALYHAGVSLTPSKMHLLRLLPTSILSRVLQLTFKSDFGDTFMYQHAMKAPDEMKQLHTQFYHTLNTQLPRKETL